MCVISIAHLSKFSLLGPCCFLGTAGREWRSFERLYEEIELREQAILWCTMIVHDITTGVQGSDTPNIVLEMVGVELIKTNISTYVFPRMDLSLENTQKRKIHRKEKA